MPVPYTPSRKVTGALPMPVDGDLSTGSIYSDPMKANADRARYAVGIAAATWLSEKLTDSLGASWSGDVTDIACDVYTFGGQLLALTFITGANGGSGYAAYRHQNGGPWASLVPAAVPRGVCHDPTLGWIVCGDSTGSSAYAAQGNPAQLPLALTTRTTNSTLTLNACVSNGAGVVVCVGEGGGSLAHIERTTDGSAFTAQTAPLNCNLVDVVFAASAFVAVGNIGGSSPVILRSTDGITWTQRPITGTSSPIGGVCWDGSKLVAVTIGGHIATSTDGLSWSSDGANKVGAYATSLKRAIAADAASGVIVTQGGSSPMSGGVCVSVDGGTSWEDVLPVAAPDQLAGVDLAAIAFGARRFMAGGALGAFAMSLAR